MTLTTEREVQAFYEGKRRVLYTLITKGAIAQITYDQEISTIAIQEQSSIEVVKAGDTLFV